MSKFKKIRVINDLAFLFSLIYSNNFIFDIGFEHKACFMPGTRRFRKVAELHSSVRTINYCRYFIGMYNNYIL